MVRELSAEKFAFYCTAFCTPDECRTPQREAAKDGNRHTGVGQLTKTKRNNAIANKRDARPQNRESPG